MNETNKNIVLIIDDETANIIALTNILSPEYEVYAAKNGKDAIELAKENLPDLILLDVIMPDMDGYEVISALKNSDITMSVPVIFITGLSNIDAEKKGLALGAADYISKPFNPDIVKLRVQSQLKIITHARALDEQIECNRELAEHSSRGKSEFLSRMSHEMRTPMNAIIGMMQVIKKRGIPDDLKVYFNEIDTASKQLLCLIDNVLDISGMEYGIFKLSNAVFNIREMFQQVLEAANYNAALKNQIFSSDIDQKLPELLNGDRKRLKQVVDNLLANAVKYTAEQGKISFAARLINEDSGIITLQIEVTDNGIGISAKQQGQIFSIFEQADGSCTREYCGIGVGLPLSKRIASMMGGNILVESELDKGAKFIFTCNLHKNVRVDLP